MPFLQKHFSFLAILVVLVSLLVFYTAYDKPSQNLLPEKLNKVLVFSDVSHSLSELNKVAALTAIGLISITFLLGPLSRMFPKTFARYLGSRKTLGLVGFGLAALHTLYSVVFIYKLDLSLMLSSPKLFGLIAGTIGLFVFFLMAITSTQKAVQWMGYQKWKRLQTTGYLALFLSILHFIILEIKPEIGFDVRPYGTFFLFLALVALCLRILTIFSRLPQRKKFEEHVSPPPSLQLPGKN